MSIIRNLSISNVVLNDLGGITVPASSDYDLKNESRTDIVNSKNLNNAITAGDIVFLGTLGNQATLQESLNTQKAISPVQPPIVIQSNGVNVAGTPHSILNFLKGNLTGSSPGVINIDLISKGEIVTSGGEQILAIVDSLRSNKRLSAEKVNYIFYKGEIQHNTYLIYNYFTTAPITEGIAVPKDATIVGVSVLYLGGGSIITNYEYDLYVDKSLHTQNIFATSGNNEQTLTNNTLDIDIFANQRIKIRAFNTGDGTLQNSVTASLFLRWRV